MYNKFTPDRITKQNPNEIFVFCSNLNGYQVGGATRVAMEILCDKGARRETARSEFCHSHYDGIDTIKTYEDE